MKRLTYYDQEKQQYYLVACKECERHAVNCLHCNYLHEVTRSMGKCEDTGIVSNEIEAMKIQRLQYNNLRICFNNLINNVLGKEYYNLGTDVYSADKFACEDIARACKKAKWFNKNKN